MAFSKKQTVAMCWVLALSAIFSSLNARADSDNRQPRILVTAQGSIDIAPDTAILSLTVVREAETAQAALKANSAAMADIIKSMQAQGIDKADLQTSSFSIQPKYFYPKSTAPGERAPRKIVGYSVRNSLTVRVRKIDKVGAILDKSIALGVNEGGNISFTNHDPTAAISKARTLAVHNAIAKATTLAKAAGVKLGDIMEISERSTSPRPAPMERTAMLMADSNSAVPVARGENTYRVEVSVSFAIDL